MFQSIRHSPDDLDRVLDAWQERYFHQPNYWRIDGALVFGFFSVDSLLRDIPPADLPRLFARMLERVAKAGLGDLHLQANHISVANAAKLKELGFQSATLYHTADPVISTIPKGGRVPYGKLAAQAIPHWRRLREQCSVPFFPNWTVGWDNRRASGPAPVWSLNARRISSNG